MGFATMAYLKNKKQKESAAVTMTWRKQKPINKMKH